MTTTQTRLVTEQHLYTGDQDAIPPGHHARRTTLAGALGLIGQAAELGVDYSKLAAVKRARGVAERVDELRRIYRSVADEAASTMATLGNDFAAGNLSPEQVVDRATDAAVLTGSLDSEARRHIENAARAAENAGAAELAKVTEEQWIAPLRTVVTALVSEADEQAERIGHDEPAQVLANTRTAQHAWEPSARELQNDIGLRHAWEKLLEVLGRLDSVHQVADGLRRQGLLPLAPGRDYCEDYRWLNLHELVGAPREQRQFWLANRNSDARPGIYTVAEMAAASTADAARELGHDTFGQPAAS